VDRSVPQRPAAMRAPVVDGEEAALHVRHRELAAAHLDDNHRAGRHVLHPGGLHETSHGASRLTPRDLDPVAKDPTLTVAVPGLAGFAGGEPRTPAQPATRAERRAMTADPRWVRP